MKKITLMILSLMFQLGARAAVNLSDYYSELSEGTFYLYNVTAKLFLTSNPTMSDSPSSGITLKELEDERYTLAPTSGGYLKIGVWGGQYLWNNNWSDTDYFKWQIDLVPESTKTYNLSIVVSNEYSEGGYTFTTNANHYFNTVNSVYTTDQSNAHVWALITKENWNAYKEALANEYVVNVENVKANKEKIVAAKGDATSLVKNPSFANPNGWSGGNLTNCNLYHGGGKDYESREETATFSQTLYDMPAGIYKVVAAVRGASSEEGGGKDTYATASVAGKKGDKVRNHAFLSDWQINTNGVYMPLSNLGGFNLGNALGWQWATAIGELTEDGALIIEFLMEGADWKGIADVHLYYMGDGTNTYAVEYTDGVDATNHALTCDFKTDNPNKVFTSTAAITTASGKTLNNNLVNGTIANLVLYDGYDYTAPTGEYAATEATLYRSLPADMWCTLTIPFVPTETLTKVVPTTYAEDIVTFADVAEATADMPMMVKTVTAITKLTGSRENATTNALTSGVDAATMQGTYTTINSINHGNYIVARAAESDSDKLYKVNSNVSLGTFRAYFTLEGEQNAIGIRHGEGTTSIDSPEVFIDDSQPIIYDLQGRKVVEPGKGIYIVNGRKVVIR